MSLTLYSKKDITFFIKLDLWFVDRTNKLEDMMKEYLVKSKVACWNNCWLSHKWPVERIFG